MPNDELRYLMPIEPPQLLDVEDMPADLREQILEIRYGLWIESPWLPCSEHRLRAWVAWWMPSWEKAKSISDDDMRTLWSSGHWPPQTPKQSALPSVDVVLSLRSDAAQCREILRDYQERKKANGILRWKQRKTAMNERHRCTG